MRNLDASLDISDSDLPESLRIVELLVWPENAPNQDFEYLRSSASVLSETLDISHLGLFDL